jgi:hypothetical protein
MIVFTREVKEHALLVVLHLLLFSKVDGGGMDNL